MCFCCMGSSGADDGQQAKTHNFMHLMYEYMIERRLALASKLGSSDRSANKERIG